VGNWVGNDADPDDWLFTYVGSNGSALPMTAASAVDPAHVRDPTLIREVHIRLRVDVVIGDRPETHLLASVVQPRNLRTY
jgi:hypothetical protein